MMRNIGRRLSVGALRAWNHKRNRIINLTCYLLHGRTQPNRIQKISVICDNLAAQLPAEWNESVPKSLPDDRFRPRTTLEEYMSWRILCPADPKERVAISGFAWDHTSYHKWEVAVITDKIRPHVTADLHNIANIQLIDAPQLSAITVSICIARLIDKGNLFEKSE